MYAARKAFMEEEASEKLWRAIKRKTRVSTEIIYQPGDLFYYKRDDLNQWKSPVTVLGRENKQILVKHGGGLYQSSCMTFTACSKITMTSTK